MTSTRCAGALTKTKTIFARRTQAAYTASQRSRRFAFKMGRPAATPPVVSMWCPLAIQSSFVSKLQLSISKRFSSWVPPQSQHSPLSISFISSLLSLMAGSVLPCRGWAWVGQSYCKNSCSRHCRWLSLFTSMPPFPRRMTLFSVRIGSTLIASLCLLGSWLASATVTS